MTSSILPQSFSTPVSIAQIARETDLSWVTARNVLAGQGTIASLDRIREELGLRWCWSSSTAARAAGRDLARKRKAKGLSQRDMAFRLAVSPQTIVSLETRFRGRIETLRGYLRVIGLHEVLALPSSTRRLIPSSNPAEADLVFTPPNLARAIIEELSPHLSGALLDPARGEGAFYDSFPAGGPRYWCELDE